MRIKTKRVIFYVCELALPSVQIERNSTVKMAYSYITWFLMHAKFGASYQSQNGMVIDVSVDSDVSLLLC